jgi:hypothetical protein
MTATRRYEKHKIINQKLLVLAHLNLPRSPSVHSPSRALPCCLRITEGTYEPSRALRCSPGCRTRPRKKPDRAVLDGPQTAAEQASGARKAINRRGRSRRGGSRASFSSAPRKSASDGPPFASSPPRSAEVDLPGEAMGLILEKRARARSTSSFRWSAIGPVDGKMLRRRRPMRRPRSSTGVAHETVHAIDSDIPHGPEGSVMSANSPPAASRPSSLVP